VQRSIRVLRVALPVVFFAFIVLIAITWRHGKPRRDKSTTQPVTSTMRPLTEKPMSEAKRFEDTQTMNGKVVAHIVAERVVAFQSGWNTLENVHLTLFRPTGLTYELMCPQAQFNSNTKEADAKGGVRVTSSDNTEIITAEIHYDGNHLTNHIPVSFRVDRWTGNAGALDIDVPGETVRLFEKFDAVMTPEDPADDKMSVKAQSGFFVRKENYAEFVQNVFMTRGFDRMTSDRVVSRFTPDRKSLTQVEGWGKLVNIVMSAVPGDTSGRKEITCDHFWSEPGPNGQIAAIDASGAPAHANLSGPPARDITALTFHAGLTNKIMTDLKADGGVVMHEPATKREMKSDHLIVNFDQATHRASTAVADGNFKYADPRNTANAVRANYDIASDKVVLTAEPGFDPTVVTDGNTLKAHLIEFSPKAQTAKATGAVIAQLVNRGGPAADSSNVFPAQKPVFVNSDVVTMRQANKTAMFSGNVRAWQENNTMFSQEMQVQGAGDVITARGNVRTLLFNTNSNPAAQPRTIPMKSRSDQMIARKNDRRIDLSGNVEIDDEARQMTAENATLYFDANKKVDHVDAEGKIVLIEQPTQRRATGDKATYLVQKKMIYLHGNPATVTAPNGSTTGQNITMDIGHNKVFVENPTAPAKGTYKQTTTGG
jgi:LPS export ABC transporter protein LptC/lipopolysaccharide transport protein LptA